MTQPFSNEHQLLQALVDDDPREIKRLVECHGAQILDTAEPKQGTRLLALALRYHSSRCVTAALRLGANPDIPFTEAGGTPLHGAGLKEVRPFVEALIAARADLNARDNLGCTPTHYAAYNDNLLTLRAFLDGGAEIDARNARGNTPAHLAASLGHARIIEELIARGAALGLANTDGYDAGDLADMAGHGRLAERLHAVRRERDLAKPASMTAPEGTYDPHPGL